VFGDERSSSRPVGVLIHPRRWKKAEQEVQSGDGFAGDTAERITVSIQNEN